MPLSAQLSPSRPCARLVHVVAGFAQDVGKGEREALVVFDYEDVHDPSFALAALPPIVSATLKDG